MGHASLHSPRSLGRHLQRQKRRIQPRRNIAEILTGKPYSRNIRDSKLRDLVEKATSPDPATRPTARQFAARLSTWLHTPQLEKQEGILGEEIRVPGAFVGGVIGTLVGFPAGSLAGWLIGGDIGFSIGILAGPVIGFVVGAAAGVYGVLLGILGALIGWSAAGPPQPWCTSDPFWWGVITASLGYLAGMLLAFPLLWARYGDKYIEYAKKFVKKEGIYL